MSHETPISSVFSAAAAPSRRERVRGYGVLNGVGWLFFGVAVLIGWLEQYVWSVALALTPAYILIGFLLSLLLGLTYDRLRVGPESFGYAVIISVVASYVAALLWTAAFYFYQQVAANVVHSIIIGEPSPLDFPPDWIFDGALDNTFPLLGWSLIRLGLQYNGALREQREQSLRAEAAARDAQLRMLAYQLNPHFLFNTLNSIRALINEDRQRARDMVTALAGYLRYALVERPLHVALLEEEVASVRGYLGIEQVRFEERLDVRLEIEPAAMRCEVPAFLLNPLVENALKHGAAGVPGAPLVLRVEARLVAPDRLRLVVENSGQWIEGSTLTPNGTERGGLGLANVRARLEALYPGQHRLEIDGSDGHVRVLVELPARCRPETRP